MAEKRFDETVPGGKFIVGGREVDANGNALGEAAPINDLSAAQQRIADLEALLASQGDSDTAKPGDADQRTKALLKEALDAKGVSYAPNLNRDGLLALAAEHQA